MPAMIRPKIDALRIEICEIENRNSILYEGTWPNSIWSYAKWKTCANVNETSLTKIDVCVFVI